MYAVIKSENLSLKSDQKWSLETNVTASCVLINRKETRCTKQSLCVGVVISVFYLFLASQTDEELELVSEWYSSILLTGCAVNGFTKFERLMDVMYWTIFSSPFLYTPLFTDQVLLIKQFDWLKKLYLFICVEEYSVFHMI